MNDAGDRILNDVRKALRGAKFPGDIALPNRRHAVAGIDPHGLATAFARELSAVGGTVHRPARGSDCTATLLDLLKASGTKTLLAWHESELPLPRLGEILTRAGFDIEPADLPQEPQARCIRLNVLARATVGVTGAMAGLADTGSLVLQSGKGLPRTSSLLPETHIALLRVRDLYPTLESFVTDRSCEVLRGSNLVLITGPSRTADIELTLTIGVHGPKTLHVVLIPDA